jgi:hypothetical protein
VRSDTPDIATWRAADPDRRHTCATLAGAARVVASEGPDVRLQEMTSIDPAAARALLRARRRSVAAAGFRRETGALARAFDIASTVDELDYDSRARYWRRPSAAPWSAPRPDRAPWFARPPSVSPEA